MKTKEEIFKDVFGVPIEKFAFNAAQLNKNEVFLLMDMYANQFCNPYTVSRQVCDIGGECKSRGENNECNGTAYCGYKKHTF